METESATHCLSGASLPQLQDPDSRQAAGHHSVLTCQTPSAGHLCLYPLTCENDENPYFIEPLCKTQQSAANKRTSQSSAVPAALEFWKVRESKSSFAPLKTASNQRLNSCADPLSSNEALTTQATHDKEVNYFPGPFIVISLN